jgi:hypothetical protein
MFGGHQAEIGHQLPRIGEASKVSDFGHDGDCDYQGDTAHGLERRDDRGHRPARQQLLDLSRQPLAATLGKRDAERRLVHIQSDVGDSIHQARLPCMGLCAGHPEQPSTFCMSRDEPPIAQRTSGLKGKNRDQRCKLNKDHPIAP